MHDVSKIDTIFYDLGDTFRVIRDDAEYARQARQEIMAGGKPFKPFKYI